MRRIRASVLRLVGTFARSRRERATQPTFSKPMAVERGSIEEPDTTVPRGVDGGVSIGVGHRREQVAERRGSESETRDKWTAPTQAPTLVDHAHSLPVGYVNAAMESGSISIE